MNVKRNSAVEREILRPLWKVHILHHASESPISGNWMLEELREHGYKVSPGTLYPMLARLTQLGWLRRVAEDGGPRSKKAVVRYRLGAAGKVALAEVSARLQELQKEVFPRRRG